VYKGQQAVAEYISHSLLTNTCGNIAKRMYHAILRGVVVWFQQP